MATVEENKQNTESDAEEILTEEELELGLDLENEDLAELILDIEEDEAEEEQENELAAETSINALEELPPLEEEDLLDLENEAFEEEEEEADFSDSMSADAFLNKFSEDEINPLSFTGTQVVIYAIEKNQADQLGQYLEERAGLEVDYVTKRQNLWRLLKIDPFDLVIIETGTAGNPAALEVLQQTKDQFPEVHFICLSGPVSLEKRLQFLNAGALDYLIRPVHFSSIAQSILLQLSRADVEENEADIINLVSEAEDIPEEISLLDPEADPPLEAEETYPDENLNGTSLQSDDSVLTEEIDLVDEDF
ncbi:MAG: hypothetical protein H8E38_14305 [SAR324 cluster bacterium]|nr:hypothetical protein [SAR324 cluster bacterium]MBL7036155.1 hypothetical protein [SAR324 cluster bacterium]